MIGTVLTQVVNGLSLASILILIALGLAVIFGLLGVINLAHADLFMAGMYTLVQVQAATGSFWLGVLAAPLVVGAIGFVVERGVVQWLRARPLDTLLATLGVGIVLREGKTPLWGRLPAGDQPAAGQRRRGASRLPHLPTPSNRHYRRHPGGSCRLALPDSSRPATARHAPGLGDGRRLWHQRTGRVCWPSSSARRWPGLLAP